MTPISRRASCRALARGLAAVAAIVVVLVLDSAVHAVMAQNPFGAPRPAAEPQAGGIVGWLLTKQSEFYRQMSATIRAAKTDGSAVWTLLAISFAYGIFHAAGPGHGKAVISSYLVANQETARRGIALSFASALMQSLVAVMIVAVCAWLLNATARTMCGAEKAIEIASYALIAAFGARLVWTKGGGFCGRCRPGGRHWRWRRIPTIMATIIPTTTTAMITTAMPTPTTMSMTSIAATPTGRSLSELAGPGGWRRGFGAIFAVGIRPCSGAILVLVFALAQGLFWAGIAATFVMGLGTAITVATIAVIAVSAKDLARRLSGASEGGGALIMRGLEFSAAGLVLLFGVGLLFGYIAAERATCL